MMKRNGDRGYTFQMPQEGDKVTKGEPFSKIEKKDEEVRDIIYPKIIFQFPVFYFWATTLYDMCMLFALCSIQSRQIINRAEMVFLYVYSLCCMLYAILVNQKHR
jgi:hypothetical protein